MEPTTTTHRSLRLQYPTAVTEAFVPEKVMKALHNTNVRGMLAQGVFEVLPFATGAHAEYGPMNPQDPRMCWQLKVGVQSFLYTVDEGERLVSEDAARLNAILPLIRRIDPDARKGEDAWGNVDVATDVRALFRQFIYTEGLGLAFHPGTSFSWYTNDGNNERLYSDKQVIARENALSRCFDVCERAGLDIYTLAAEEAKPLMNDSPGFGEQMDALISAARAYIERALPNTGDSVRLFPERVGDTAEEILVGDEADQAWSDLPSATVYSRDEPDYEARKVVGVFRSEAGTIMYRTARTSGGALIGADRIAQGQSPNGYIVNVEAEDFDTAALPYIADAIHYHLP